MSKFMTKLEEALDQDIKMGNMVGGDKPDAAGLKLDGKQEASARGTHRRDGPVKYHKLDIETEFQSKEHGHSDQARPGLD